MVAGDHGNADARLHAFLHGRLCLRAQWIDQPDQPHQGQRGQPVVVKRDVLVADARRCFRQCNHAIAVSRHRHRRLFDGRRNDGFDASGGVHVCAIGQHHLQGAFDGDPTGAVPAVGGGGVTAVGLERNLRHDLDGFAGFRRVGADFIGEGQQGDVDGVAVILPCPFVIDKMSFVAKNADSHQRLGALP